MIREVYYKNVPQQLHSPIKKQSSPWIDSDFFVWPPARKCAAVCLTLFLNHFWKLAHIKWDGLWPGKRKARDLQLYNISRFWKLNGMMETLKTEFTERGNPMHDQFNIQDLHGGMAPVYKWKKKLLFCKLMAIEMKDIPCFSTDHVE